MAKIVFSGLVTAWRFAGCPTRTSPSLPKATIDGVVRAPSAFSMTFVCVPSITATQELVVPRSMPITLLAIFASVERGLRRAGRCRRSARTDIGSKRLLEWKDLDGRQQTG